MKIVALVQTHNERRFIANCIEHLHGQGVSVYVVDNGSTDATVEISERYVGRGVVGIEQLPREQAPDLPAQLKRKEELAASLDADWFIHIDADELHLSPDSRQSLADALRAADDMGFNVVNFLEFTFVPTAESPDHDHPEYERTMRWYYPFLIDYPHRLNAWKRQDGPVDLVSSDGHRVEFPGRRMWPRNLYMRHFLFLGEEHAREKYTANGDFYRTSPEMVSWRLGLDPKRIKFPSERLLRHYVPGEPLDRSEPLNWHLPILVD